LGDTNEGFPRQLAWQVTSPVAQAFKHFCTVEMVAVEVAAELVVLWAAAAATKPRATRTVVNFMVACGLF
jgi:hypothetical protein